MTKRIIGVVILCFQVFFFCGLLEAKVPDALIKIARNRIASVEDRKKAIDELKTIPDPEVTRNLIEILQDSQEPILLRRHALDALLQGNDLWLDVELKKILNDASLSPESRQYALYGLWKLKPDAIQSELLQLAQKTSESKELRVDAINYLGLSSVEKWPPNFWINLYARKTNPAPVRIAALNNMEKLGLTSELQTAVLGFLQDPSEDNHLRKSSILTGSRILPKPEFEEAMIFIVSKPQESLEMKRYALDLLSAAEMEASSILRLRQILSHERNPLLLKELNATLSRYKELPNLQG